MVSWATLLTFAAFTTLESLDALHTPAGAAACLTTRIVIMSLFSLEALLRCLTHQPSLLAAWRSPVLWCDVLSTMPFWLRVALAPETLTPSGYFSRAADDDPLRAALRIAQPLATLRLMQMARYYEGAELLLLSVKKSLNQLLVALFMLSIMAVCTSALLVEIEWSPAIARCVELWVHGGGAGGGAGADGGSWALDDVAVTSAFIETHPRGVEWTCEQACAPRAPDVDGPPAELYEQMCATCEGAPIGHPECIGLRWGQRYHNIPTAMWFVIATVTPGVVLDPYVYPETAAGRLFMAIVTMSGILFLAMPLATVGTNFLSTWNSRHLIKLQRQIRQLLTENGVTERDCAYMFKHVDSNGDGRIEFVEFARFTTGTLGLQLSPEELTNLWKQLDAFGVGSVDVQYLFELVFPGHQFDEQPTAGVRTAHDDVGGTAPVLPKCLERTATGVAAAAAVGTGVAAGASTAANEEAERSANLTAAIVLLQRELRVQMSALRTEMHARLDDMSGAGPCGEETLGAFGPADASTPRSTTAPLLRRPVQQLAHSQQDSTSYRAMGASARRWRGSTYPWVGEKNGVVEGTIKKALRCGAASERYMPLMSVHAPIEAPEDEDAPSTVRTTSALAPCGRTLQRDDSSVARQPRRSELGAPLGGAYADSMTA